MMFRLIATLVVTCYVMHVCTASAIRSAHDQKRSRSTGFLDISAFNIKTFGASKMSDPEIAEIIKNIVLEYDLILIQEIRDITNVSFTKLLSMLNVEEPYGMIISQRLGRSSYKEQYAYFYRESSLELMASHQYSDPDDLFEREPFSALFRSKQSSQTFVVSGLHAKPAAAVIEIGLMAEVYDDVLNEFNNPNVILMGDFNADCSYARKEELEPLRFYSDNTFRWLTPWEADTTTSQNTDCAYDRLVVTGDLRYAVADSFVYHFEDTYNLSFDEMWAVSDHYPVSMRLEI